MSDVTDAKFLGLTANQLAKEASKLRAENAKLREFASELFRHWSGGASKGCMICEHETKACCCDCYYEEEAKRLGIEVPE